MEEMEKEFVPYELALELKDLGFDEPCFGIFMKEKLCNYTSPLGIANSDSITALTTSYSDLIPQAQKDWVVAPLYQQAFRWFRKESGIEGFVHKSIEGNYYFVIKRTGNNESNMYEFTKTVPKTFDTYEETELACLEKLIEIVEQNK
jgi:hypothetical protein